MTNSTHTQGPWVIYDERAAHGSRLIYSSSEYGVGEVWDINNNGENKANAHLIAAAPELLKALEALLRDAETMAAISGLNIRTIEPARAVIAKAKGTVE